MNVKSAKSIITSYLVAIPAALLGGFALAAVSQPEEVLLFTLFFLLPFGTSIALWRSKYKKMLFLYVICEILTSLLFFFVAFGVLWGLAYGAYSASIFLVNVYMFVLIPFLPLVLLLLMGRWKMVAKHLQSDSLLVRIVAGVITIVSILCVAGILMIGSAIFVGVMS